MSDQLNPEPSCSKEQPKQPKSAYGKCFRSSRILNKNTHNTFCMNCFAHAEITSDHYELVITYHLTNGLDQYICVSCNIYAMHDLLLNALLVLANLLNFIFNFANKGLSQSLFRIDLFSNTLEGSILSLKP